MSDEQDILYDLDDEIVTCWCGAKGPYSELFDDSCLDSGCAGTGELNCYCGGDLCVCHNHGGTECPGCDDCDFDDESYDYDPEDFHP
jgi:hypothetical protein